MSFHSCSENILIRKRNFTWIMIATLIFIGSILLLLVIAIVRARRMNKEQSSLGMHPSNFEKPQIENVQKSSGKSEN